MKRGELEEIACAKALRQKDGILILGDTVPASNSLDQPGLDLGRIPWLALEGKIR